MACAESYTYILSKSGDVIDRIEDYDYCVGDNPTIWDLLNTSVCVNNWITELSATQGGVALDHNSYAKIVSKEASGDHIVFYDATPDIPDIALRIHNTRIRR